MCVCVRVRVRMRVCVCVCDISVGALGFVWYVKRKSKESNDTVITAMKKELLKAHRAQGRQDYQRAEDHYHKALKLLSDPIIEDEQEGLEARAVTLDMVCEGVGLRKSSIQMA